MIFPRQSSPEAAGAAFGDLRRWQPLRQATSPGGSGASARSAPVKDVAPFSCAPNRRSRGLAGPGNLGPRAGSVPNNQPNQLQVDATRPGYLPTS